MNNLKIAAIQSDLVWENAEANRAIFEKKILNISSAPDLIILPEMFTTGFSMQAEKLAEEMDGSSVEWLKEMAAKTNTVLAGSLIISENKNYYNRFVWANPDGTLEIYDKRHLFSLAGEDKIFTAGIKRKVIDFKGWKIALNVCYDLRFPVWSRNRNEYDLLINIASWPEIRSSHWRKLLQARAIENLAYVIGVNRVGLDGKGFNYCGDTTFHSFDGEIIESKRDVETVVEHSFDYEQLTNYRNKFAFLADQDQFEITMN